MTSVSRVFVSGFLPKRYGYKCNQTSTRSLILLILTGLILVCVVEKIHSNIVLLNELLH